VSSAVVVGDWNGVPWDPSLRRVREYLTIVSELLTGARVTCESGPYVMRGSRLLMHVPDPPPAIVLAALGPNMLSLAGEMASGAVLNYAGSRSVPDLVGRVQAAAKAAQRADGGKTAIFVRACVVDDPELARLFVQREVMYHVTVKAYRRVFEAQGWGEACTEAMRWWAEGDRKRAAASLPDAMTDALILAGPAEDIRARFEAFRETGVDEPIVFPIASRTDPTQARAELDATLCALAPASRPSENWR
jgi:alkanesulfonate monooxygenase SsuD/methylene tetrahydromethanopterin reductase-like flavin-dependent oxidoreductase (luciferase family)